VAAAEDALSEAFLSALAAWPRKGCPSNQEAWLVTVARQKMIDAARRCRSGEIATGQLRLLAIYAAFTEGWTDPGGAEMARRDLTGEALFLARLVAELLPEAPEALGLLALMLHAEARRRARRNSDGEYVPLAQQNPALWDWQMIHEAETLLRRASALGSIGRYQLEGTLQSAHIYRRRTGHVNWAEVVQHYNALSALTGSPVVAISRALAIAELQGASATLEAMQEAAADVRLAEYQPYWAARAELLARTGAYGEARHAYEIAIGLERDPAVRRFLQRRQSVLAP
jgi:RNA polymerase sigma-70 factor (ECF subfamily)